MPDFASGDELAQPFVDLMRSTQRLAGRTARADLQQLVPRYQPYASLNISSILSVASSCHPCSHRRPLLCASSNGQTPDNAVPDRLFSNLNRITRKHEPGSVVGAALLVSGTTIGAGILAVPAITEPAGFTASAVALGGCCAYAIITGLLLAEVTLNIMAKQGAGGLSLVTMVKQTIGPKWQGTIGGLYIFQHYALLVAYIARAGEIIAAALSLPTSVAASLFALVAGGLCYQLTNKQLDALNGLLVAGICISFLALVSLVLPSIEVSALMRANWAEVPNILPVIALSFVYHNVVPVIVKDLEGDAGKIRLALILGSLLPFLMFLLWEVACLGAWGTLSATASNTGAFSEGGIIDPVRALSALSGVVGPLVDTFSLLAILTSYFGFCLGLSDFLVDAFGFASSSQNMSIDSGNSSKIMTRTTQQQTVSTSTSQTNTDLTQNSSTMTGNQPKRLPSSSTQQQDQTNSDFSTSIRRWARSSPQLARPVTFGLTVAPPLVFAISYPDIFFTALDIAATYGVMTLFGLLPAAMAWEQRRKLTLPLQPGLDNNSSTQRRGTAQQPIGRLSQHGSQPLELVSGGYPMVGAVGGFALFIITYELCKAAAKVVH